MTTFMKKLQRRWDEGKFVCVGLDTDPQKLPKGQYFIHWKDENIEDVGGCLAFNSKIIDATRDLVLAYKPNIAFYTGPEAEEVLYYTIRYIRKVAPDVPVILDSKRGDIGNTNVGYVQEAFDYFDADAVTVSPYFGQEAMQSFLDQKDKGIIVLCRTSNKGAGEFQDHPVSLRMGEYEEYVSLVKREPSDTSIPLYQYVAFRVSRYWNTNGNCAVVVGATCPQELAEVREIVGDMPILIPGIGAQGGDLEATVKAGKDSRNQGMIINSARGIIFASDGPDFPEAARRETQEMHSSINQYRN